MSAGALKTAPDSPARVTRQHAEIDAELKASGLAYTILRPHNFMQNTLMAAGTIASDGAVYMPLKDGKFGMIDVRDIADVAVAVLTSEGHEGQSYLLTGPEALSMAEVAARLSAALGKTIEYVNLPPDEAKARLMATGTVDSRADAWVKIAGMISMGMAAMVTPAVKDVLGREPRSIDQFAKDFAAAFTGSETIECGDPFRWCMTSTQGVRLMTGPVQPLSYIHEAILREVAYVEVEAADEIGFLSQDLAPAAEHH